MTEEEAYQTLAKTFGYDAASIRAVLEAHFAELPSNAGWEHMTGTYVFQGDRQAKVSHKWTRSELWAFFRHMDALCEQELLPPAVRYIKIDHIKKDKRGKSYVASNEQLQQELAMQDTMGIDPDGNLVQNGQIVKYRWLQSFNKPD